MKLIPHINSRKKITNLAIPFKFFTHLTDVMKKNLVQEIRKVTACSSFDDNMWGKNLSMGSPVMPISKACLLEMVKIFANYGVTIEVKTIGEIVIKSK